jgi:hypothetical protein
MTGLLFFIVFAMWASVLIPIGLKNHDRRNLEKSLLADGQQINRWHWQAREDLTPRQKAFIRRRRVAMVLLTALISTVVMSTAGRSSFFWIALPAILIALFSYAASKAPSPSKIVRPVELMQPKTTQTISNSTVIVEKTFEQKIEVQKRTWVPIEIPMPSYLTAERARASDRTNNSARTWTSQEMIDAAVKLTEQRAQKLKEAQARLEEARALAMENARRAAVAANENNGNPVTPFRRAVNQ